MARFLLATLAVLAFAASPITASAAPMSCTMDAVQAVGSDMASMDGASADRHARPVKSDPCCGKALKGCAKSCSMICAGAVAVLATVPSIAVFEAPVRRNPPEGAALRAHPPPRLDRPPKSGA
jgi:hypothetical protein